MVTPKSDVQFQSPMAYCLVGRQSPMAYCLVGRQSPMVTRNSDGNRKTKIHVCDVTLSGRQNICYVHLPL